MTNRIPRIVLLIAVIGAWLGVATPQASAATFTVNKTADTNDGACEFDDCSLREAIAAANAAADADAIVLPKGYYRLDPALGSLVITQPVTITGAGAGRTEVVGDEFGQSGFGSRVFDISAAQSVTLSSFTVRGGQATGAEDGGGIRGATDQAAALVLDEMRVQDNTAEGGGSGGISGGSGTVTVASSVVSGNSAPGGAGGIGSGGALTVASSVVSGNSASGSDNVGGAIRGNDVTITSSILSGNEADFGGGIFSNGSVTITSSTLSGNSATDVGGGIHTNGTVTVTSSTLSGNSAPDNGGGIHNNGTVTITSSTLSGNEADFGGGIHNNGTVTVTSSTVSGNSAGVSGGGISNNDLATATLTSSIVIGNSAPSGPDCAGPVTSAGFNVVGTATGCPTIGDDVTSPNALFLGPLANNGGPTETHTIAAGSPPVGLAAGAPNCDGTTRDQRGVPRPNNGCDAGAYELAECQGVVINIVGTNGRNNLVGTRGPDGIIGQGGNDRASGGGGSDGVCGGPGNDRLGGGTGRDHLSGGKGNDNLDGGPSRDTCLGGSGRDRFRACETRRQ